ncbi:MAG: lactonase family protein, partial [bacterium]|nr:lactonase family protein [bacterium]
MKRCELIRKLGLRAVAVVIGLGALWTFPLFAAQPTGEQKPKELLLYIGTYTFGKSEGIYVYRMDLSSGVLKFASVAKGVVNPSFLAFDPTKRYLYSVSEVSRSAGKPGGAVSAFRRNPQTGELTFLNQQPSGGEGPCHLIMHRQGKFVFVAHYAGGCISVLPIREDGRLGEPTDVVRHQGSGVNPQRQEAPHPHSVNLDAANRFLFVPDLGLDKIMIYRVDLTEGKLKPNEEPWARVKAGAGPRHFDFHPNGKYAYVINELDSTFTAFAYDNERGTLREIETVPTLPENFTGTNTCADVHVAPSGKFLYGSNRGHDSIVVFAINEDTGKLTYVGHEPTQGKTPRNFGIVPTGDFL